LDGLFENPISNKEYRITNLTHPQVSLEGAALLVGLFPLKAFESRAILDVIKRVVSSVDSGFEDCEEEEQKYYCPDDHADDLVCGIHFDAFVKGVVEIVAFEETLMIGV